MKKLLVLSAFIAIFAFAAEYLIDYQVAANEVVSGRVHNQQVTLRPNGRLVICRLREIRNDEKGYVVDNFPGEDPYHNPDMVKVMDIDGVGKLYIFYRDIDVRPVYRVVENRVVKWVPRKQLLQSEIPGALRYVGPKPSGPFQIQHPDERSPQTIVLPPEPKPAETAKEELLECWHAVVYLVTKDGYLQGVLAYRDVAWDTVFDKDTIWGGYRFATPKDQKTIDISKLLK